MKKGLLTSAVAVFVLSACGGEAQKSGPDSTSSVATGKATTSAAKASGSTANASTSAAPSAATSAASSATPATSANASASTAQPADAAKPASLETLFDGAPDAAIKMKPQKFGGLTIGVPEGWSPGANWDSVDTLANKAGSAKLVLIRLDVSEAYLDSNVATWSKVPFINEEMKWTPRVPGAVGAAHLPAKLAQGTGLFFKDEAEFWQAAIIGPDKKYPVIVLAALKKSADAGARAELVAAVRSVEWK